MNLFCARYQAESKYLNARQYIIKSSSPNAKNLKYSLRRQMLRRVEIIQIRENFQAHLPPPWLLLSSLCKKRLFDARVYYDKVKQQHSSCFFGKWKRGEAIPFKTWSLDMKSILLARTTLVYRIMQGRRRRQVTIIVK